MAREKFPSDDVERLMLRFPAGMREQLKKNAEANSRSLNSEIIHRLEQSLATEQRISKFVNPLRFEDKNAVSLIATNLLEMTESLQEYIKFMDNRKD